MKKITISKVSYDYTCGDGCCSEYGHTWYVDGEQVHSSPCDDNALKAILAHLGFDATIDFCNEKDGIDDPDCSL
jgi:hypothetical protein